MPTTIRDVARASGVHVSTVSRTFSAPHMVNPETRSRVLATAESMGYRPNRAARALITGRTGNIGLIVADITNPYFPPMIKAAEGQSRLRDYHVFVADTDEDPLVEEELVQAMAKQVDGVVLASPRMANTSIERLARDLAEDVARRIKERVSSVVAITDRMQAANRHLLGKLRPMALGHVALADAVASLVTDFEGADPDRRFMLEIGRLAYSYGNCIDLTVYRCLQEGITNAARHAGAGTVSARVGEEGSGRAGPGDSGAASLRLSVRDDGSGIAPGTVPGMGWSGMEERVRALGGRLSLLSEPGSGTRLEVLIPLETAEPTEPAGQERT